MDYIRDFLSSFFKDFSIMTFFLFLLLNEISYSEFIKGNPPTVNVMGIQLKPPLTKLLTLM